MEIMKIYSLFYLIIQKKSNFFISKKVNGINSNNYQKFFNFVVHNYNI